ncbi:hypothetical protein PR048_019472 [Dryococelus australis]|uniref:Uncharacterized protein n=1 Tax=Dryococelus australis TaxID=614101 RepID=A0ABQ9H3X2_9NEOP|nr:hypothetical protein PR048_019472 [Dryococelus australis]
MEDIPPLWAPSRSDKVRTQSLAVVACMFLCSRVTAVICPDVPGDVATTIFRVKWLDIRLLDLLLTMKHIPLTDLFLSASNEKFPLDRRMNKVVKPMATLILYKAEEYTTCIQADLKQGFQKCSFYRELSMDEFTPQNSGLYCFRTAALPSRLLRWHTCRQGGDKNCCLVCTVHLTVSIPHLSASGHPRLGLPAPRFMFPEQERSGLCLCLYVSQVSKASIPGGVAPSLSHVGIVADGAVGRRVFSGISRFPPPFHSDAVPYSPHFILIGSQDFDGMTANPTSELLDLQVSLKGRMNKVVHPMAVFRMWESCWTMQLVGGFSRGTPVSPALSFPGAAPCSPQSASSALKTSMLRADQISSLTHPMAVLILRKADEYTARTRVDLKQSLSKVLSLSVSTGGTRRLEVGSPLALLPPPDGCHPPVSRPTQQKKTATAGNSSLEATWNRYRTARRVNARISCLAGRGGLVVRLLACHQYKLGSVATGVAFGFPHVESCRTMPLVDEFSRGFSVSSYYAFRRCSSFHPHRLSRLRRSTREPRQMGRRGTRDRRSKTLKSRPQESHSAAPRDRSANYRLFTVKNRIRLETESQRQSSDIQETPYDLLKRCRELTIKIKASERNSLYREQPNVTLGSIRLRPRQLAITSGQWASPSKTGNVTRVGGGCLPGKWHCTANRAQYPVGSPDFRMWESCRTMPSVSGSYRGYPVSLTPSFRCCSILTSITLIGSQDPAVKSRSNIFTRHCNISNLKTAQHRETKVNAYSHRCTLHICKPVRTFIALHMYAIRRCMRTSVSKLALISFLLQKFKIVSGRASLQTTDYASTREVVSMWQEVRTNPQYIIQKLRSDFRSRFFCLLECMLVCDRDTLQLTLLQVKLPLDMVARLLNGTLRRERKCACNFSFRRETSSEDNYLPLGFVRRVFVMRRETICKAVLRSIYQMCLRDQFA